MADSTLVLDQHSQPNVRSRGLRLAALRPLARSTSLNVVVGGSIAVLALVLSLTHPWSHAYAGAIQFGDAAYWDMNAESWARGYVATKTPDIRPGFSVFLGIVYVLFGTDWSHGFVAVSLLFAASSVMVFLIGTWIAGRLVGLFAGALFALNPYMWEWTATSTTDVVGAFANLASILFLVLSLRQRNGYVSAGLSGAFYGAANVIRVFTLSFIGPVLLILLLGRGPIRRKLLLSGAAVAGATVVLALGALYQYRSTGDAGLSSNSASAVFAASSPKYGIWTPEIYDDVAGELQSRGIDPTPQNMDAEFTRLAIQNYLNHPLFQVQRVIEGMRGYIGFEGEVQRPDRYFFFRPHLVAALAAAAAMLLTMTLGWKRAWLLLPPLALIVAVEWQPLVTLAGLRVVAVSVAIVIAARRRRARELGLLAIALYWATTGIFAVFSAGIAGALLNRLYIQVEAAQSLLIACGAAQCSILLARAVDRSAWARLTEPRPFTRMMLRLPGLVRPVPAIMSFVLAGAILVGTARLTMANILPPPTSDSFPAPTQDQLQLLAASLHLQTPILYVDQSSFPSAKLQLTRRELPPAPVGYAVPGQFTRFIWNLADEERTMFWFVFSDTTFPAALDRTLLLGEAAAAMDQASLRDQDGLLIMTPTSAYNDEPGAIALVNVISARAFVPWDEASHRFRFDKPTVYPLATSLFDRKRVALAETKGTVRDLGPTRVAPSDRVLLALLLQPQASSEDPSEASITYQQLHISRGTRFHTWLSLHPSSFGNPGVQPEAVRLLAGNGSADEVLDVLELDPSRADQWRFGSWDVDLSRFEGQTINLTVQIGPARSSPNPGASVLVAEPSLITP